MSNRYVIALGTFDGIHMGHRALIERAKTIALENGMRCMIYTFREHPLALFDRKPKLLMKNSQRIAALKGFGCEVEAVDFTAEYAAMPPKAFAELLYKTYDMAIAVAGFNYTFGDRGSGDVALLRDFGGELDYSVCEMPPTYYEGKVVSSTRIRSCLEAGDIKAANAMLEDEYRLSGSVVANRHIGSGMGYPTANLGATEELVLPASGVYATIAELDGISYKAVTNIGSNPTVEGRDTTIETHILDFSGDIYGQELTVRFVERLRGDRRFESLDALAGQIAKDVRMAREILEKQGA